MEGKEGGGGSQEAEHGLPGSSIVNIEFPIMMMQAAMNMVIIVIILITTGPVVIVTTRRERGDQLVVFEGAVMTM